MEKHKNKMDEKTHTQIKRSKLFLLAKKIVRLTHFVFQIKYRCFFFIIFKLVRYNNFQKKNGKRRENWK